MLAFLSRVFADAGSSAPKARARGAVSASCFHCSLPIRGAPPAGVEFEGRRRPMCCSGCHAVFDALVAYGMTDLYRERDAGAA